MSCDHPHLVDSCAGHGVTQTGSQSSLSGGSLTKATLENGKVNHVVIALLTILQFYLQDTSHENLLNSLRLDIGFVKTCFYCSAPKLSCFDTLKFLWSREQNLIQKLVTFSEPSIDPRGVLAQLTMNAS